MNLKKITIILNSLLVMWACSCRQAVEKNETEELPVAGCKEEIPDRSNIKTISRVEYLYKGGEPDLESAFTNHIKEYNREGSLVKETKLFRTKTMRKYEEINLYYYNESEKTDSILIYKPRGNRLKSKWVYMHDGNNFKVYEYSPTGELQEINVYECNENDDVISIRDYSPDGVLTRESLYTYDDIGEKSHTVLYDGVISEEKIRINDDPLLFEWETRDSEGNLKQTTTYRYNEDKRVIEDITLSYDEEGNRVHFYHSKYHYFDNGLSKEDIKYNQQGEPVELFIYQYEKWE